MRHRASLPTLIILATTILAVGCGGKRSQFTLDLPEDRSREAVEIALRGDAAERAGDSDKAIALYREALAISDDLGFVWNNLGVIYSRRQNYAAAVGAFDQAAARMPSDPRPLENKGIALHQAGYVREALDAFKEAMARDRNYMPALRGAVRASHLLGLTDEEARLRVREALMRESDPTWRQFFTDELARIDSRRSEK